MRSVFLLGACASVLMCLSGCDTMGDASATSQSAPPSSVTTTPVKLTAADEAAVKDGVKQGLKDPTSPLFGTMAATKGSDGNTYVCGYVNAKNSYGGYVGDQPYMGMLVHSNKTAFLVVSMGGVDEDTLVTNQMCGKYGLTEPYQPS